MCVHADWCGDIVIVYNSDSGIMRVSMVSLCVCVWCHYAFAYGIIMCVRIVLKSTEMKTGSPFMRRSVL